VHGVTYFRGDVQAFFEERSLPQRIRGELNLLYLDANEAAEIAGYTPRSSW
jgi:hypothetical protein